MVISVQVRRMATAAALPGTVAAAALTAATVARLHLELAISLLTEHVEVPTVIPARALALAIAVVLLDTAAAPATTVEQAVNLLSARVLE
jgi:N-acetylglucosamine-6-phosphate deacetylase